MISYVILSESDLTAGALVEVLKTGDMSLVEEKDYAKLVFPPEQGRGLAFKKILYERCSEKFRDFDHRIPRNKITVIVDQADLSRLNPTSEEGWESGLAFLILLLSRLILHLF